MLRSPPKFTYSGLTIVLSNPSRFDNIALLSAAAGHWFDTECLRPELNRYQCDIRLADDTSHLLKDTKAILLLGQYALYKWTDTSLTLGEIRGTPLYTKDIFGHLPAIASFLPQDAMDIRDFEGMLNEHSITGDFDIADKMTSYEGEKKRGKTSRGNFRFWLQQDVKRIKQVLENDGKFPVDPLDAIYNIYPSSEEVIQLLRTTKDSELHVDIETDGDLNIRCIGFCFESYTSNIQNIYVVPFLTHTYLPAYDITLCCQILAAFAIAFHDNTTIAHNGAIFDFFIFGYKYRIPVGRKLKDTMLMQHRCFPTVEKSLGHCISLHTWQMAHKQEGVHSYNTPAIAEQLWKYCGKDVFTMILIKRAIESYAKTVPGLTKSIEQVNSSIYVYLLESLMGMNYQKEIVETKIAENDEKMTQYLRIMKILHGDKVKPLISNKTCIEYFHEQLDYPVVKRSKKTKRPSLDEHSLLKLRLQHTDNAVIDVLLAYRHTQKETGVLKFIPFNLANGSSKKSQD